ncbi:hypothetical protein MFIFM68171_02946 [Madurella fahalii]|uniref:Uncharacterized protein n=1 Tax=Madurella fahalii TaxID=1157608 RepID=A0ABQ0G4P2_9PEZI
MGDDTLAEASLVTANGALVTSKSSATVMGMAVAGRYQWLPKGAITDDVMATMNAFYATRWPNKLTIDTT